MGTIGSGTMRFGIKDMIGTNIGRVVAVQNVAAAPSGQLVLISTDGTSGFGSLAVEQFVVA
jgi:hypothetical protein